jgi:hypothetical protein
LAGKFFAKERFSPKIWHELVLKEEGLSYDGLVRPLLRRLAARLKRGKTTFWLNFFEQKILFG